MKIARPSGNALQRSVYSGHKRAHDLKYQTVIFPDGLTYYSHGLHEGCRQDLTVWLRSGLEEQLSNKLTIDGAEYFIYGDAAYVEKQWISTPHSGSYLTPVQSTENSNGSKVRSAVE